MHEHAVASGNVRRCHQMKLATRAKVLAVRPQEKVPALALEVASHEENSHGSRPTRCPGFAVIEAFERDAGMQYGDRSGRDPIVTDDGVLRPLRPCGDRP